MAKQGSQKNVQNIPASEIQNFLTGVQEYFALYNELTGRAEQVLNEEKDPQKVHELLIKPSEKLAGMGVKLRSFISDRTKECHGPKGSIADRAVQARRKLFETKAETKETKEAEPAKK